MVRLRSHARSGARCDPAPHQARSPARHSLSRWLQRGRQDHLHRPAYAAIFQIPGAHGRHRPLSHSSRGGGKNADRSDRAALPSRSSDRHTRRAGGCARAGVNWNDYDRFMQKYVKRIGDERLTKLPKDLDTKPYRDEHDDDLLRRMLVAIDKGRVPKGFRGGQLRHAAREIRQYVRRHETLGARLTAALEQAMK